MLVVVRLGTKAARGLALGMSSVRSLPYHRPLTPAHCYNPVSGPRRRSIQLRGHETGTSPPPPVLVLAGLLDLWHSLLLGADVAFHGGECASHERAARANGDGSGRDQISEVEL